MLASVHSNIEPAKRKASMRKRASLLLTATRALVSRRLRELHTPTPPRYCGSNDSVLQCTMAYNTYGGYCVPLSSRHRPASQSVLNGQVYEPETIAFIARNADSGDIVHAGAYFGDFIPALSQACSATSRVWAFEPNPENYRCASITIALNDIENVSLHQAALGEQYGRAALLITNMLGTALGGRSHLLDSPDTAPQPQSVLVTVRRLDDVVPLDRRVTILHLDVEGAEQRALSGAIAIIKRSLPILILESLPDDDWLSANIFPLGYTKTGVIHTNTILAARPVS